MKWMQSLSSSMTHTGVERCGASSPTSSSTQTATTSASTASFRSWLVGKIHYLTQFVNKFDWFEFSPWRNPSRDVANGLERLGPDCRFVLCRSHNWLLGLVNPQTQAVPRRGLCRCLRPHFCSSWYVANHFGGKICFIQNPQNQKQNPQNSKSNSLQPPWCWIGKRTGKFLMRGWPGTVKTRRRWLRLWAWGGDSTEYECISGRSDNVSKLKSLQSIATHWDCAPPSSRCHQSFLQCKYHINVIRNVLKEL